MHKELDESRRISVQAETILQLIMIVFVKLMERHLKKFVLFQKKQQIYVPILMKSKKHYQKITNWMKTMIVSVKHDLNLMKKIIIVYQKQLLPIYVQILMESKKRCQHDKNSMVIMNASQ